MKKTIIAGLALIVFASCSMESLDSGYMRDGDYYPEAADVAGLPASPGEGGGDNGGGGQAGVITAGEWCDLDNWDFWGHLMTIEPVGEGEQQIPDYGKMAADWGFNTARRVAVHVKDANGDPVANAKVELLDGNDVLWTARTSNKGNAQLWKDLSAPKGQESGTEGLKVKIDGVLQEGDAVVSTFASAAAVNEYTVTATAPEKSADVAFIVDATGSMGDEISFLKQDLLSILQNVRQSQSGVSLRTGAVFYRDKGDNYVTRVDNFNTPEKTSAFIKKQSADGGGDLPEAVHTALEVSLQSLSWNAKARARMAFLILDAPAHIDHDGVVESLQKSIRLFSESGIRIVPVLCSTGDKTTEFMCRDFAIVTGGTYVFLTDDSGVGESHLEPTVGEYEVEKLNELICRLIEDYIQ